ncbi:MAG: hypothetical protein ACRYGF_04255 [Janthinobacterium lividum]
MIVNNGPERATGIEVDAGDQGRISHGDLSFVPDMVLTAPRQNVIVDDGPNFAGRVLLQAVETGMLPLESSCIFCSRVLYVNCPSAKPDDPEPAFTRNEK